MSYHSLPHRYPGMYRLDEETGKWDLVLAVGKKDPLCQVKFCTRPSEKACGTGGGLKCGTCRVRVWRANNPIRANYNAIKNKARRRKIPFGLTYAYFEKLCLETGFHFDRGRAAGSLHIDRIDNLRGYYDDNVQILTASENVTKSHKEAHRSADEWEEYDGSCYDEPEESTFTPNEDEPF